MLPATRANRPSATRLIRVADALDVPLAARGTDIVVSPASFDVHSGRKQAGWQFWIDRGGTFTDLVARRPAGSLPPLKLLPANPERSTDSPVARLPASPCP